MVGTKYPCQYLAPSTYCSSQSGSFLGFSVQASKLLAPNLSSNLNGNKKQFILEQNMSDYDSGTWIQFVPKDTFHCGSGYMIFYQLQNTMNIGRDHRCLKVSVNCQFDRIKNHLGDRPPGTSVRGYFSLWEYLWDFLDCVIEVGRPAIVGGTIPWLISWTELSIHHSLPP